MTFPVADKENIKLQVMKIAELFVLLTGARRFKPTTMKPTRRQWRGARETSLAFHTIDVRWCDGRNCAIGMENY